MSFFRFNVLFSVLCTLFPRWFQLDTVWKLYCPIRRLEVETWRATMHWWWNYGIMDGWDIKKWHSFEFWLISWRSSPFILKTKLGLDISFAPGPSSFVDTSLELTGPGLPYVWVSPEMFSFLAPVWAAFLKYVFFPGFSIHHLALLIPLNY